MKNPYILPICFAAAAHGALLFGFSKSPAAARPPKDAFTTGRFEIIQAEPEPVVVEVETTNSAPQPAPAPSPIRGPELVAVETNSPFTITPPPIQPVNTDQMPDVSILLPGVPGGTEHSPFTGDIVGKEFLDNTPRTRFQATPVFPFQAKREGIGGEVHVDFTVDEHGKVIEPRVVKSSHPMFEEPTLKAVAKWQFEPGKRNGRVVKFRMTVPVRFSLNDGS